MARISFDVLECLVNTYLVLNFGLDNMLQNDIRNKGKMFRHNITMSLIEFTAYLYKFINRFLPFLIVSLNCLIHQILFLKILLIIVAIIIVLVEVYLTASPYSRYH